MATNKLKPAAKHTLTEREWREMKCDVCVVGWIGMIMSSATLLLSAVALHFRHELVEMFLEMSPTYGENYKSNGNRIVIAASTTCYALSLLNLVVSTMLLIGIERRSSALLFPWLIYHSICFGGLVHIGLYVTVMLFFEDLPTFLMSLMAFTGCLTIFAKILHDVYTCISKMEEVEDQQRITRDAEKRANQRQQGCCLANSSLPYYTL